MQRYLDTVRELARSFKSFSLKQIHQGENAGVDGLSKLASTSFDHLSNKALVEILLEISIENK